MKCSFFQSFEFILHFPKISLALEIFLTCFPALAVYCHLNYALVIKILLLIIPYFIKPKSFLSAVECTANGANLQYNAADFQNSVTNLEWKESM